MPKKILLIAHTDESGDALPRSAFEVLGAAIELVRTLISGCQAENAYAESPRVQKLRTDLTRASRLAQAIGLQRDYDETTRLLATLRD